MKLFLSILLLTLSYHVFSQTVTITGRCYYDVNGNQVYDGTDSVLSNTSILANLSGGGSSFTANTNAAGQYNLIVPVESYDIRVNDAISYADYNYIGIQHRDYTAAGSDIVDFAFQQRDSIVSISSYLQKVNFNSVISNTGGSAQYVLRYSYDGLLKNIPATVTLNFNPKLTPANISPAPAVNTGGKLQWNFSNVQRTLFYGTPGDSITLTFNFPTVGDTIHSFKFDSEFVPAIAVTTPVSGTHLYYLSEYIDFPAPLPIGTTSGIKWLRHYAASVYGYEYDDCRSVDTTQNGENYFIAGNYEYQPDTTVWANSRPFIAKLNKDGLSVWEKYVDSLPSGISFDWLTSIKHTPDGGCIVLGTSPINDTIGNTKTIVLVAKFDSSGNFTWSKSLSGARFDEEGQDLITLVDGSCLITGYTASHDGDFLNSNADTVNVNVFVTKISAGGNVIFTKIYGGAKDDYGFRIKALSNGNILMLGFTESNNGDVVGAHQHGFFIANSVDTSYNPEAWVLRLDAAGNIIWSKCFGGSGESYLAGAQENNGGILLTGATNSKDGDLPYYPETAVSLWVLQISNTGNIVFSKLHKQYIGYQDSNYVSSPLDGFYDNVLSSSLHKTKDGNFILGGSITDKYGPIKATHGLTDFAVVKINPVGDILWQKSIGGTDFDYMNDLQLDKNNDIIFVGNSTSDNDDLYQHHDNYRQLMVVGKIGITNIVKGQVFVDNNGNHIKDPGEQYYSQGRINTIKFADTITARIFHGRFLSNVDTGNYVTTYLPANNYYTVFPATRNTSFTSFDLKDSFDFALAPRPNMNDLEVQLLPLNTPRPGFDVTYRIITKNVGTTTISNAVIGFKCDSRQAFLDASRIPSGIVGDSTWWGPFTLNAFDIDTLYISLTLEAPPILNNGDTLSLSVTANPVSSDSSKANNVAAIREIVRGSFDPNDKTEIHAGTLTTTQYAGGEYLQYLVRFQNTGTDTAFFVTVKDTLQSRMDPGSLEVIAASHPYTFRLNANVANWDFKKINLPDSTTDEAGSHGYILFKIKPATGLTVGDEFSNKAAIYFDYNLPVITNQDRTAIGANNGVCPGGNAYFNAGITGATYQWQVNTGTGFTNLTNGGIYSGVTTATLQLTAPPTTMVGYRYRCVVNATINSPENKLKFSVRWKSTAGTAWENTANWDCGVLPDAQTEVVIPAGTTYPLISSNPSCYSLRLSPGSTVTVKTGFKLTITGKGN